MKAERAWRWLEDRGVLMESTELHVAMACDEFGEDAYERSDAADEALAAMYRRLEGQGEL